MVFIGAPDSDMTGETRDIPRMEMDGVGRFRRKKSSSPHPFKVGEREVVHTSFADTVRDRGRLPWMILVRPHVYRYISIV